MIMNCWYIKNTDIDIRTMMTIVRTGMPLNFDLIFMNQMSKYG